MNKGIKQPRIDTDVPHLLFCEKCRFEEGERGKTMKFVVKCSYCDCNYFAEDEGTMKCPNCGAQNGMKDVTGQVEDEEETRKRREEWRQAQEQRQRTDAYKSYVNRQKRLKTVQIVLPIIMIAMIILSFGGCAITSLMLDMGSDMRNASMTVQNQEMESSWKEVQEVRWALPTLEAFMEAIREEDYEAMLACMYLPEGSYTLIKPFQKGMQDSVLGAFMGSDKEITKVVYSNSADEGRSSFYEMTIGEDTIRIQLRRTEGEWKVVSDSMFYYNYPIRVPDDCTIFLNDIELNRENITSHETAETEYSFYTVPALAKGEYTARVETAFGTYTTAWTPRDLDYDETYARVFGEGSMIEWEKEACKWLNDFWTDMYGTAMEGQNVEAVRQYFTEDISDEMIAECLSNLRQYINEQNPRIWNCEVRAAEVHGTHLSGYDRISAKARITVRADWDNMFGEFENSMETGLRFQYTESGMKIAEMEGQGLFTGRSDSNYEW